MIVQGVLVPGAVQGARVRHPREGGGRPSLQSGQRLGRQHQQGQVTPVNPSHFDPDPDQRIRTTELQTRIRIRFRIRIVLFSSVV
jgi:hypothetical protein